MKMISKNIVPNNIVPNKILAGIKCSVFFIALAIGAQVNAATPESQVNAPTPSQCKGLVNDTCITANSCSWVEGYERKDGRVVNSFCRTKAKPKSASVAETISNDTAS